MRTIIFLEKEEIGEISEYDFPVYLNASVRLENKKYIISDIEFVLMPQGKYISWERHVYLGGEE